MKNFMGFNRKFRGKTRVHLMEVCFNNHGRFIRLSEFISNRKSTFLVIPEGENGRGWENLKIVLSSMLVVPSLSTNEKGRQCREKGTFYKHVGPLCRSFANVVREEGPRRGDLVLVGRWARVVVCECHVGSVNWVEVGRALTKRLGHKGVVTIIPFSGGKGLFFVKTIEEALSLHDLRFIRIRGGPTVLLRRWSPKENSVVEGKFREGWLELRGLPFHLWYEVHLKKIMEQWGTMTEIDWRMIKLFDLSKARVRAVMKERSILPALIEVLDGGWEFTVSVAVAGEEDVREMGESTRQKLEPHSWTGERKRAEEAKSTAVGRSSDGAVGRMKEGKACQKAKFALVGTRGKRRPTVGNNWS